MCSARVPGLEDTARSVKGDFELESKIFKVAGECVVRFCDAGPQTLT